MKIRMSAIFVKKIVKIKIKEQFSKFVKKNFDVPKCKDEVWLHF